MHTPFVKLHITSQMWRQLTCQMLVFLSTVDGVADDHWAFRPPVRPEVPATNDQSWSRNPIDRFVLARLEHKEISPSPQADKRTLLRRLSLDLTGLPPQKSEIESFLADDRPQAWERTVNRFLKSPHYGERWAAWWLDGARYADTNGYEVDRPRSMWPWRDWVIQAFNDDMHFDQFTIEQIAGDMLPDATTSQHIATGFHRNSFMNEEGGHDWEQFRYESVVDRVHTTATVFMGLTLACAQCHDHKFDPFTQEEYYRFFALLNNDDEPELEVPDEKLAERQAAIDAEISRLESERARHFPLATVRDKSAAEFTRTTDKHDQQLRQENLRRRFAEWVKAETRTAVRWHLLRPRQAVSANNATITVQNDGSMLVTGDRPELDTYEIVCHADLQQVTGFRLEAIPDARLPNYGPGRGSVMSDGTFAITEFDVRAQPVAASPDDGAATLIFARADATYQHDKRTVDKAIDNNRLTSWHTNNAARRRHVAVFELDEPWLATGGTELTFSILQNFIHQQTLGRFRLFVTDDRRSLQATLRDPEIDRILLSDTTKRGERQTEQLIRHYLSVADELAEYNAEIDRLRQKRPRLPTTLVLSQRTTQRPTHRHERGDYRRPAEQVVGAVPVVLQPVATDGPPTRLDLARWLVDRGNPLTARVIVNRIWQQYFGRGLVATPEDFGVQGEAASHPQLLDWLAVEFMERNWSLKSLHELIVTSATYQQASRISADRTGVDADNILLSRGPRHRVSAEMVRDIVLTASGLLDPKIGGPSVFPAQPGGAIPGFGGFEWKTSEGGDVYRRSLYTFRQRSAPFAVSSLFDAPPGLTCTVQRSRSTTPLQALALLNDSLTIDASRALALRILNEDEFQRDERLAIAFEICTSRLPDSGELQTLRDFLQTQKSRFRDAPEDAAGLAGESDGNGDGLSELAAWTATVRMLLNLNEVIVKQ